MKWIDTHTHLNVSEFDNDRIQVIENALQNGIIKMILPNIDAFHIPSMSLTKSLRPDSIELMMGLHPCSVKENYKEELVIIRKELFEGKYKAVGEIGLDLYWDKTSLDIQKDAFMEQLKWSHELNLPVSIHSREATQECLECIVGLNKMIQGVFHCFSGTVEQARKIVELGMFLGIGGVVTYKKTNLPEIINAVGLENLVLETDSPYLSPVPNRGKRNESSYISLIGRSIADILNSRIEEVAELTTFNAQQIFRI
ncbi:MAG: TatD family hydrolase [Saprospiraceae bacterium]|nr:TatD family hydrolase [Saprospiraceae bacterium]